MFWLPLMMAGAGALQGHLAERDQKKHNEAAAESTRYSSWTGRNPMQQRFGGQTALGGALQGGVGGMMLGQQLGGFGGGADPSGGGVGAGGFAAKGVGDSGQGMLASPQAFGKQTPWKSLMNRSFMGDE